MLNNALRLLLLIGISHVALAQTDERDRFDTLETAINLKWNQVSPNDGPSRLFGCHSIQTENCIQGYTNFEKISNNTFIRNKDIRQLGMGDKSEVYATQKGGFQNSERTFYYVTMDYKLSPDQMMEFLKKSIPDRDFNNEAKIRADHSAFYAGTLELERKVNEALRPAGITVACVTGEEEHNPKCRSGLEVLNIIAKNPRIRGRSFNEILIGDFRRWDGKIYLNDARRSVFVSGEASQNEMLANLASMQSREQFEARLSGYVNEIPTLTKSINAKLAGTSFKLDNDPGHFSHIEEYAAYVTGLRNLNMIAHLPQLKTVTRPTQLGIGLEDHSYDFEIRENRYLYLRHNAGAAIMLKEVQMDSLHPR